MSISKPKVLIAVLLVSVPAALILARLVVAPAKAIAEATRDDYIASELRSELQRIYQKRYAYPRTLETVWNDPEFQQILKTSLVTEDRSHVFVYDSTGSSYEFRFTNGTRLVIERGDHGAPSREVIDLQPAGKGKKL